MVSIALTCSEHEKQSTTVLGREERRCHWQPAQTCSMQLVIFPLPIIYCAVRQLHAAAAAPHVSQPLPFILTTVGEAAVAMPTPARIDTQISNGVLAECVRLRDAYCAIHAGRTATAMPSFQLQPIRSHFSSTAVAVGPVAVCQRASQTSLRQGAVMTRLYI